MKSTFIMILIAILVWSCNPNQSNGKLLKLKGKSEQKVYGCRNWDNATVVFYESKNDWKECKRKVTVPLVDIEYIKEVSE